MYAQAASHDVSYWKVSISTGFQRHIVVLLSEDSRHALIVVIGASVKTFIALYARLMRDAKEVNG